MAQEVERGLAVNQKVAGSILHHKSLNDTNQIHLDLHLGAVGSITKPTRKWCVLVCVCKVLNDSWESR